MSKHCSQIPTRGDQFPQAGGAKLHLHFNFQLEQERSVRGVEGGWGQIVITVTVWGYITRPHQHLLTLLLLLLGGPEGEDKSASGQFRLRRQRQFPQPVFTLTVREGVIIVNRRGPTWSPHDSVDITNGIYQVNTTVTTNRSIPHPADHFPAKVL